jgi:hypothetical protein
LNALTAVTPPAVTLVRSFTAKGLYLHEPVQGLNLNRRSITRLETEMPITVACYGFHFVFFEVLRTPTQGSSCYGMTEREQGKSTQCLSLFTCCIGYDVKRLFHSVMLTIVTLCVEHLCADV